MLKNILDYNLRTRFSPGKWFWQLNKANHGASMKDAKPHINGLYFWQKPKNLCWGVFSGFFLKFDFFWKIWQSVFYPLDTLPSCTISKKPHLLFWRNIISNWPTDEQWWCCWTPFYFLLEGKNSKTNKQKQKKQQQKTKTENNPRAYSTWPKLNTILLIFSSYVPPCCIEIPAQPQFNSWRIF